MTDLSITLRALHETDFEQWKETWTEYLNFYETTVEDDIYTTTFARLISPENSAQEAIVAMDGDTMVGLVHYIFHPHNWKIEDTCYLQDLFVASSQRGNGIGRALIEAVYAAADARGIPSVYWMTQDFNTQARLLYDNIATLTPFIKYSR